MFHKTSIYVSHNCVMQILVLNAISFVYDRLSVIFFYARIINVVLQYCVSFVILFVKDSIKNRTTYRIYKIAL